MAEGKIDPIAKDDFLVVKKSEKIRQWVEETAANVLETLQQRSQIDDKFQKYYLRRHQKLFRDPTYPWRDSSNIVMPLIDLKIDQIKPSFTNLITPQGVNFMPLNETAVRNASNAQNFFDYLMFHKVEGYKRNMNYVIDDMLQFGWGIAKVVHNYETRKVKYTLKHEDLPDRVKGLAQGFQVVKSQAEKNRVLEDFAQLPPEQLQQLPTVVTAQELIDALEIEVKAEYNLDPEETMDQDAIASIIQMILNGEGEAQLTHLEDVHNEPVVQAIAPYDFIVPFHTRHIQDADWTCHRLFFSDDQLRARARNGKWDKKAVENILKPEGNSSAVSGTSKSSKGSRTHFSQVEQQKNFRENIPETIVNDRNEIWEICGNFVDEAGVVQKLVVTVHPTVLPNDTTDSQTGRPVEILKIIAFPYAHGRWPYVQFPFEPNDPRFHSSRGVPEKLDDIDLEITAQHRFKLNTMMIQNSPTFLYRLGSKVNPNSIRWTPGEFIPVVSMNDVQPVQMPHNDLSFDSEENVLRTWSDQYLGTFEQAIVSPSTSDARSATEVAAIQNLANNSASVRGQGFQGGLTELYNMVWDVWLDKGPREVEAVVGNYEPVKYTRAQIKGNFDIMPIGDIGEFSRSNETAKARDRLLFLANIPQEALGPGVRINLGEALIDWMEKDDVRNARRIIEILTPDQIAQLSGQEEQREADDIEAQAVAQGFEMGIKA